MPVNKEVLIQGVGVSQFRDLSGSRICNFLKNDSLEITHKQNFEMVRAGDSMYAYMDFLKDAEGQIKLNSVIWDWEFAKMIAGTTNVSTGQASTIEVLGELLTVPSTGTTTLKYGATLQAASDKLYYVDTGVALTRVANAGAVDAAGKYAISVAGEITWHANDAAKEIYADYTRTVTGIVIVDMKKTSIPPWGQLIHTGRVWKKDATTFQIVQTHIYKCKFDGQMVLNFQQAQASSNQLTLNIFDPGRSDEKVFTMKFAEA